ncbi:MAG: hypothetical protein Q4D96_10840 [Propionibacteriaceae bacterium]|nr:hypothetical protein [Propionibacteriaceae bacterium]
MIFNMSGKARLRAFLDANILAKPFTRTLLLVASAVADARFRPVWSGSAEAEAEQVLERRFGERAVSLEKVRNTWGFELSVTGAVAERFQATSATDRQILADAAEAKAQVLVTEDVDDFALLDLDLVGVTAVHHDLFASELLTDSGYRAALEVVARGVPVDQIHAATARLHPRLFSVFAEMFPGVEPEPGPEQPRVQLRGSSWIPSRNRV